jgi:hypothetical protein
MKDVEQDIQSKDDYIRIINGKSFTSKHLTVCNIKEWFTTEYYTIKQIDNEIIIKKCYYDIPKNAIKLNRLNNILSIVTYLEAGKYYVDLEKTEDKLIIILK